MLLRGRELADTLDRNATFHRVARPLTFSSSHAAPVGWSRRSRDASAASLPEGQLAWPQSGVGRTQREQVRLQQQRRLPWLPGRCGLQKSPHSWCQPMPPSLLLSAAAFAWLFVVFRQLVLEQRISDAKKTNLTCRLARSALNCQGPNRKGSKKLLQRPSNGPQGQCHACCNEQAGRVAAPFVRGCCRAAMADARRRRRGAAANPAPPGSNVPGASARDTRPATMRVSLMVALAAISFTGLASEGRWGARLSLCSCRAAALAIAARRGRPMDGWRGGWGQ